MADDEANKSKIMPLEVVKLSDGSIAYKLNAAQAMALSEMLADRIWWDGAKKRTRRISVIAVGLVSFFAVLSSNWPWISSVARSIFRGAT